MRRSLVDQSWRLFWTWFSLKTFQKSILVTPFDPVADTICQNRNAGFSQGFEERRKI